MELTEEQKNFIYMVTLNGNWSINENGDVDIDGSVWLSHSSLILIGEILFKFNKIKGNFYCHNSELTTLKNFPNFISGGITLENNKLTDYFKSIKEENFPHWKNLSWGSILHEYPFLIDIGVKYLNKRDLKSILNNSPQTKLYLEG